MPVKKCSLFLWQVRPVAGGQDPSTQRKEVEEGGGVTEQANVIGRPPKRACSCAGMLRTLGSKAE